MKISHKYKVGDICVFTNKGISGIVNNDGKPCKIVRLKLEEEWAQGEPEYVIEFLKHNHGFGVRECELKLSERKE